MERTEFRALLEPLCRMFGRTFDVADWTVYYQALQDLSAPLLGAAIVAASREPRAFMPRPGELRALAEAARRAAIAAHPWTPCEACAPLHGFVETTDAAGVARFAKCACIQAHRDRLARAGIPSQALVGDVAARPDDTALWEEAVMPDPRALPIDVARAIRTVAAAHHMPTAGVQTDLDGRPLK